MAIKNPYNDQEILHLLYVLHKLVVKFIDIDELKRSMRRCCRNTDGSRNDKYKNYNTKRGIFGRIGKNL